MKEKSPHKVIARAYSHNDYEGSRPLHEALDHGFGAVEADIWLIDGQLLVGHDLESLKPERSLENLYLKPLLERVQENQNSVYSDWPHSLQLLVDIKSGGHETYLELHKLLEKYKDIITTFQDGAIEEKAVTVVISGNRPRKFMGAQDLRYAGYDGRMADLHKNTPALHSPQISDNWSVHFKWQGQGQMMEEERQRLRAIVKTAHARGHRCRFWGLPDKNAIVREAVWKELVDAGVDYINTDHISHLHHWLSANDPRVSLPRDRWCSKDHAAHHEGTSLRPLTLREKWARTTRHARTLFHAFNHYGLRNNKHWSIRIKFVLAQKIRGTRKALRRLVPKR